MPRAPRRCPGCDDALIHPPRKYCPACSKERAWKGSNRGPETAGRPWRKIREAVLTRDGRVCAECGVHGANHADHIVPKSQGGGDEMSNLQTMCARCHNRKTGRESGRGIESKVRLRDLP